VRWELVLTPEMGFVRLTLKVKVTGKRKCREGCGEVLQLQTQQEQSISSMVSCRVSLVPDAFVIRLGLKSTTSQRRVPGVNHLE
jgi:hypothetical protein